MAYYMKKYVTHEDHTIYPTPRFNENSGCWRIQLTIRYKDSCKRFNSSDAYNTREEAESKCINYGKELINEGIDFKYTQDNHILINI